MAMGFCEIILTDKPLKIPPQEFRADAGAVVDFFGVVRDEEAGEKIPSLEYEAHAAMAEHQLLKIAEQACEKFGCHTVVLHHRTGSVPAAEPSLFVRVTARHRGPAFDACRWVIERLKQDVPIWKAKAAAATPGGSR